MHYSPLKQTVRITALIALASCVFTTSALSKTTFKTLVNFNGTNGSFPGSAPMVQGANGNLYGTTSSGGKNNGGTVFELTPAGKLTTLYNFCSKINCADGEAPEAALLLATNGNFYGTTLKGGTHCVSAGGCGTIFAMTPAGKLTTLYSFCAETNCTDGQNPRGAMIEATDGNFYGTTFAGGNSNGGGTLFEITPAGKLTTSYTFCSQGGEDCYDGSGPTGVVQGSNGKLYGTTTGGGKPPIGDAPQSDPCSGVSYDFKDVFPGAYYILKYFCNPDAGEGPSVPAIEIFARGLGAKAEEATPEETAPAATQTLTFYGTMTGGGPYANGSNLGGTVYSITSAGKMTVLYSFCAKPNCADGAAPGGPLALASDGNFYGTTAGGGNKTCVDLDGCGTVFEITPAGGLTTLHLFDGTDGAYTSAGLVQATNGTFYGTTPNKGANGDGTIFSISVGLGSFVEIIPISGSSGTLVTILGNNMQGTTSVAFDGIAAKFTVVSATEITATVPPVAKTGAVEVETPTAKLYSNIEFQVP